MCGDTTWTADVSNKPTVYSLLTMTTCSSWSPVQLYTQLSDWLTADALWCHGLSSCLCNKTLPVRASSSHYFKVKWQQLAPNSAWPDHCACLQIILTYLHCCTVNMLSVARSSVLKWSVPRQTCCVAGRVHGGWWVTTASLADSAASSHSELTSADTSDCRAPLAATLACWRTKTTPSTSSAVTNMHTTQLTWA